MRCVLVDASDAHQQSRGAGRTTRRPAERSGVTRSTTTHAATGPNQVLSWNITGCRPPSAAASFTGTSSWTSGAAASSPGPCTRASADHVAALIRNICAGDWRRIDRAGPALRQRQAAARLDHARDAAMARHNPVVESEPAICERRDCTRWSAVRRLVPHRASAQRHSLPHSRPAPPRPGPVDPRRHAQHRGCLGPPMQPDATTTSTPTAGLHDRVDRDCATTNMGGDLVQRHR